MPCGLVCGFEATEVFPVQSLRQSEAKRPSSPNTDWASLLMEDTKMGTPAARTDARRFAEAH